MIGVSMKDCYCFGQNIYAPFSGRVVLCKSSYSDKKRAYLPVDLLHVIKNALTYNPTKTDIYSLVGNCIILEQDGVYAMFAHLQKDSVVVEENQNVEEGQLLGKVGNSGNTTAPHLHFQLMDSLDLLTAKGIPCAFKQYEVYRNGTWVKVNSGIPAEKERISFNGIS